MKHLFLLLSILCCVLYSRAETVYSISNGFWSAPSTWSTNTVPVPTDTVIVDHYVIYTDSLFIDSIGHLLVDSCGTLCGDYHLQGHFINYGHMYIGSFGITQPTHTYGYIICNNTGWSWVASGYMTLHSGWVKVGPYAPPCEVPRSITVGDCQRVTAVYNIHNLQFTVYPNPATNYITLTLDEFEEVSAGRLLDVTGRVLQNFSIEGPITNLPVADLQPGYYTIVLTTNVGQTASKRFLKLAD